jgi:hypothetical protein
MDHLPERPERLEQQTHTVEQQQRRWRSVACGFAMLGLLGWGLPLGLAREEASEKARHQKGLEQRVAALEQLLKHVSREGNEITIKGANLHIVNGLGSTDCGDPDPIPDCPNGLGNLIVGYNEPRFEEFGENVRTGSHNIVVGLQHNSSHVRGLVVGCFNEISGGVFNTASGISSSVGGGAGNTASGNFAAVSGGESNTASGNESSVSGGRNRMAEGEFDWVAGGLFEDE